MKKILCLIIIFVALQTAACSRTITEAQYIGAMESIGCQNLMETSPQSSELLKKQGITSKDIETFRKKMNPKRAANIAMEISRRVMECHNVNAGGIR